MATNHAAISAHHGEDGAHQHPSLTAYVRIAIILAIITAVEVSIYYMDFMHTSGMLVPALVVLSIIKFVMVVGYFMHVKFDKPLIGWMFFLAMMASLAVFIGVWVVFKFNAVEQFVGYLTAN